MRRLMLALLICLAPLAAARAQTVQATDGWVRATQPGRPGAVYLNLNGGPDRLTGAASPVAGRTELHETIMEDGQPRMRATAGVLVSPGAATRFMPGGLHIMLLDLKKPLKEGEVVPLILTFERARTVAVNVPVVSARATGPGAQPTPAGQARRPAG